MSRQVWRSSGQVRFGPSEHTSQSRHFLFRGKSRGQAHPARQCAVTTAAKSQGRKSVKAVNQQQRVSPRSPGPQTAGAWRHVCACDANRPCRVHTAYGADSTWRNYTLSVASQPAHKVNQGPDAIKKQGAALCPEDIPVLSNTLHDLSSTDWKIFM